MNKKHVVIATYDGIGTYYCGVGTIAKNLVYGFDELSDSEDIRISIAFINVDKTSKVFNKQCYENAEQLIKKTSGYLLPLYNNTRGESEWDMWRSFPEWEITAKSLVTSLNTILREDEDNFIILNDTPFLVFSKYKNLINIKNINYFYFPLSTGKNHVFGSELWRKQRIELENECFNIINNDKNSKVISLGKNFANRMHEDYGIDFTNNDYLQNGLCFDNYADFLDKKFSNKDLEQFNIKLGSSEKIIFSWGRCSIAKGFKELAEAWVLCYKDLPDHNLILQIPNNSGENDYFLEIKNILKDVPRVKIIDDFNPNIWKTILRNINTNVVCIPSLMDPFPHTAIEAKLFNDNMNYTNIISNVDGAIDAFDKTESFYINPKDIINFSKTIIKASKLDANTKKKFLNKNKNSLEKFNFPLILKKFFESNININLNK